MSAGSSFLLPRVSLAASANPLGTAAAPQLVTQPGSLNLFQRPFRITEATDLRESTH